MTPARCCARCPPRIPDVVIHQLTDLPRTLDTSARPAEFEANARLRIEGTKNLMAAASVVGVRRVVAQSIAFAYAPGPGARVETDPLDVDGARAATVRAVVSLEEQVLDTPGIDGVVLRYGRLYGRGTWYAAATGPGALHVDAAAHAALLAVTTGRGIYNIAEDDGAVSSEKAKRELGFDAGFRMRRWLSCPGRATSALTRGALRPGTATDDDPGPRSAARPLDALRCARDTRR